MNMDAKTPRHIPRYNTGYWHPVKPWNDGFSKRKISPKEHKRLQQWTGEILAAERGRKESLKNRIAFWAMAIAQGITIAALAALWIIVCACM